MHLHSPGAYNFLRQKFNSNLPHESTIRKWYANCNSNGEPGIQNECLWTLGNLVAEYQEQGKSLLCSLAFDEMAIKQVIQWSDVRKKFLGYVTYGDRDEPEDRSIASHAIVFLLSGIDQAFSIPVAYHFIKSLKKDEKKDLLIDVVTALTQIGITIVNITFDGLSTNFLVCKSLGACLDTNDLHPYFQNPVDGRKIYIILDACHMLKLWRNSLGNLKIISDGKSHQIEWAHFENLENCRVNDKFVTHKLTKRHIQWDKDKMNVRLAAQTLSSSVSKSLTFLMNNQIPGFENCSGTAEFAKRANDLFDIFNSSERTHSETRVMNESSFKNEILTGINKDKIFDFLEDMSIYINSLNVHGRKIVSTRNKTGFLGFLINIESLKGIYREYIERGQLKEISTMRFSQDFLESFFGRVRALNGSNTNPTQDQFISSFRKLLVNSELRSSPFANCADNLSILTVSSKKHNNKEDLTENVVERDCEEHFVNIDKISPNDFLLDIYQLSTTTFNAGSIEANILNIAHFDCKDCFEIFKENILSDIDFMRSKKIRAPCKSTVDICIIASKYAKLFQYQRDLKYKSLVDVILQNIDFDTLYINSDEHQDGHMFYLVKFIVEEYLRLHFNSVARTATVANQKIFLKNKYKNIVKELGL